LRYGYSATDDKDRAGIWTASTAQAGLLYLAFGYTGNHSALVEYLLSLRDAGGGLRSLYPEQSGAGAGSDDYPDRAWHLGAAAWTSLAQAGVNPLAEF